MSEDVEKANERISRVEGQVAYISVTMEKMDKKLDAIASGGKLTLGNVVSICLCIIALGGVLVGYVSLATRPLSEAAQVSIKDRDAMHQAISISSDKISNGERRDEKFDSSLTEIETQFRAADQVRNIQFANQLRYDALLWERIFGTRFPSDIQYYPSISQKGP
jgi:hypothetical protein